MVWYGLILIIVGIFLLTLVNFPIQVLQIMIVLFPVLLAIGAGYEMYNKNSHRIGEAFMYSSGAIVLAASIELIILFILLKPDDYSTVISKFQGLEFPIAIFGLAISIVTGIDANVTIRKELSDIKRMIRIKRYRRFF